MEQLALSLLWLTLASGAPAAPADDRAKAQAEVEQQMRQMMVKIPPPQVEVIFAGVDKPVFELEDAHFALDDESLATGEVAQLTARGPKTLYTGPVEPGPHQLQVKLVYHRNDVSLFSGLRTFKYRIESAVPLRADNGLVLHIRLSLHVDDRQEDPKKQLKFSSEVKPEMLAGLDDAPLPELAAAKKAAQPVAPPPVVEAEPIAPAAPPPPAAAAEVEKTAKSAEPVEKLKKKLRTDRVQVAEASPAPAAVARTSVPAAAALVDAGSPAVAQVAVVAPDAGALPAMARIAPDAGSVPESPPPETNYAWLWWGLGLFGVVAVLIGVARRRQNPTLEP